MPKGSDVMNVFMTGATGFIGKMVVAHLQGAGYQITAWVRDVEKAKDILGEDVKLIGPSISDHRLNMELELSDVVVNLAGKPIVGVRWNAQRKEEFVSSRVATTERLVDQINRCQNSPKVLISASAVGYYGDRGSEELHENSSKGQGFLPDVCSDWEEVALNAAQSGTRVCILRLGIVLGREGGMLSQIAPLSQLGFSVNLGSGQQYISWIHITDVVRIILFCMENESISGPINCVSPSAISVSIFADAVKKATNALLVIRIPYLLLRLIFGEGEQILTSSQNCRPSKLSRSGYEFMFPELGHSLAQEFGHHHVSIRRFSGSSEAISGQATTTNPPGNAKYELRTEVILNSNAATIFSFFSSPKNLGLTTPPWVNFRILSMPPSVVCESEIAYKIRLAMVPMKWVTRIVDWQPETRFVDVQQSGPYRIWWHEHRIIEIDKSSSYLTDWVVYRLPFGILGKIIHRFFIKRALILIFSYRRRVLKYRFNSVP